MRMMLVPLDGGRPIPLEKAIVFFGRSSDCDVVITASKKVSRKHCCIAQIDDRWVVRDLGSMNGLRVNDELIDEEAPIQPGDEIWIGDVGYRFLPLNATAVRAVGANRIETRPATPQEKPAKKSGSGRKTSRKNPTPGGREGTQRENQGDPRALSQDYPVAIPDEDQDFLVEGSQPVPRERNVIAESDVYELSEGDVISDDEILEIGEDDVIED